jgi:hypothetical protein
MGKMRLNPADAEQVAQETLRRFIDPKYAGWDRAKEPSLFRHLGSIFNGVVRDMRTKKGFNRERLSADGVQPDGDDPAPSQVERTLLADLGRRAVGRMLELSAGKDLVEKVFMLMVEETDRPSDWRRASESAGSRASGARDDAGWGRRFLGHLGEVVVVA